MTDPHEQRGPEPDPDRSPDLEPGGGVPTGSPPASGGTSDVSEHEPDTRFRFPRSGIATMVAIAVLVIVFVVVIVGLVLMATGVW